MDPNVLREQLEKLHEELERLNRVEPDSSQLLGALMQDIQRLLRPSAQPAAPEPNPSLPDRLEQIAVRFEVDHPTLAASSRRLVDLLGKAGL